MLPTIMHQMSAENIWNLKTFANSLKAEGLKASAADDDVPQLVENFDEASKNETTSVNPAPTTATASVETPAADAQ